MDQENTAYTARITEQRPMRGTSKSLTRACKAQQSLKGGKGGKTTFKSRRKKSKTMAPRKNRTHTKGSN